MSLGAELGPSHCQKLTQEGSPTACYQGLALMGGGGGGSNSDLIHDINNLHSDNRKLVSRGCIQPPTAKLEFKQFGFSV